MGAARAETSPLRPPLWIMRQCSAAVCAALGAADRPSLILQASGLALELSFVHPIFVCERRWKTKETNSLFVNRSCSNRSCSNKHTH